MICYHSLILQIKILSCATNLLYIFCILTKIRIIFLAAWATMGYPYVVVLTATGCGQ